MNNCRMGTRDHEASSGQKDLYSIPVSHYLPAIPTPEVVSKRAPPPSYESLFQKNNNSVHPEPAIHVPKPTPAQPQAQNSAAGWIYFFLFGLCVTSIVFGVIYYEQCDYSWRIPLSAILLGSSTFIFVFLMVCCCRPKNDNDPSFEDRVKEFEGKMKFAIFICVVLIMASVGHGASVIFPAFTEVDVRNSTSEEYCEEKLYYYSFGTHAFAIFVFFCLFIKCISGKKDK